MPGALMVKIRLLHPAENCYYVYHSHALLLPWQATGSNFVARCGFGIGCLSAADIPGKWKLWLKTVGGCEPACSSYF